MRIGFVCGVLEPGHDGVGDFTRRLAAELIRQGHLAIIIAINDTYVSESREEEQLTDQVLVKVYRLPSVWKKRKRFQFLNNRLSNFNFDWVSLQYVGFGLNRYGLPWELLYLFKSIVGDAYLHIMFHELWCGMSKQANGREKLLGFLQKSFIKILITVLQPKSIFTSIKPYAACLQRIGIEAHIIPIFGNIPLEIDQDEEEWQDLLIKTHLLPIAIQPKSWLVIGFFGSVYFCPGLKELLEETSKAAAQLSRKLAVLSLGKNNGKYLESITEKVSGTTYMQTGPLSLGLLNRVMQLTDLAVITTPVDGLNKSGSAIAWLERGIPIIVSPQDHSYIESEMKPLGVHIIKNSSDIIKCMNYRRDKVGRNRLLEVAKAYTTLGTSSKV